MQTPTIGRIVHYRLSDADAAAINAQQSQGNHVDANDVVAAIVVRVWVPTTCNLRLMLDGECDMWVTSRTHGNDMGNWDWPQFIVS